MPARRLRWPPHFGNLPDVYPRVGSPLPKLKSVVQQPIELGPDVILFGASNMAVRAFLFGPHLCCRRLRLIVIEVKITPAMAVGKTLGILDRDVGAVQLSGEEASPGGLGARSIRVLGWKRQLQFLEEDRSLREHTCLLVDLVRAWLDVDVVVLWKVGLAVVKRIGGER